MYVWVFEGMVMVGVRIWRFGFRSLFSVGRFFLWVCGFIFCEGVRVSSLV